MSNFNYCSLVRHFCGQVKNQKLEQVHERTLRILFADCNLSNLDLLKRAGTTTLLIQRLRLTALTVFKSLHGLNPPCLNDMFTPKYAPYQMLDSSLLEQFRCRTTTYGLRLGSYIGAKLWNELPNDFKATIDFTDFKRMLQTWTGSDFDDPFRFYIDTLYKLWICMFLISGHSFIFLCPCLHVHHIVYRPAARPHSAPVPYPTVRRFVTEMCTCAHLCCRMVFSGMLLWCTVGFVSWVCCRVVIALCVSVTAVNSWTRLAHGRFGVFLVLTYLHCTYFAPIVVY